MIVRVFAVTSSRSLVLSAVLGVIACCVGCETSGTPSLATVSGGPVAEVVDGNEHDFGVLEQGGTGKYTFVIRNDGTAPLELRRGTTTCKCTMAELDGETLAPGEEAKVHLEWKAEGIDRYFRQSAEIHTNDRTQPILQLTVKGQILRLLALDPPELRLTRLNAGESSEHEFLVFSPEQRQFAITDIAPQDADTAGLFEVTYEPASPLRLREVEAKSGYVCRLKVVPGLPVGRFQQDIRITTDIPESHPVELWVYGRVQGDLSVLGGNFSDDILPIGQVRPGQGTTRELKMFVRGEHTDINITEVICDPADALEVTVGERTPAGSVAYFPLTVTVPGNAPTVSRLGPGAGGYGQITIRTDHPQTSEVRILVKFAVVGR